MIRNTQPSIFSSLLELNQWSLRLQVSELEGGREGEGGGGGGERESGGCRREKVEGLREGG